MEVVIAVVALAIVVGVIAYVSHKEKKEREARRGRRLGFGLEPRRFSPNETSTRRSGGPDYPAPVPFYVDPYLGLPGLPPPAPDDSLVRTVSPVPHVEASSFLGGGGSFSGGGASSSFSCDPSPSCDSSSSSSCCDSGGGGGGD